MIGALCPWCLTITGTTTLVFFSITRVNILDGNLRFGTATAGVQTLVRSWVDVYLMVIILAVFAAMVVVRYLQLVKTGYSASRSRESRTA